MMADRQAEAGPAIGAGCGAVGLGEGRENALELVSRDADAGIRDTDFDPVMVRLVSRRTADRDGNRPHLCELDGIADQIGQDLTQAGRVGSIPAFGAAIDRGFQLKPFFSARWAEGRNRPVQRLTKRKLDGLQLDLARLDLGQVQHIIDDGQKQVTGRCDCLDHLALPIVQPGVAQDGGHAQDTVQGRADFMAHLGQEDRLGRIGAFRGFPGIMQALDRARDRARCRSEDPEDFQCQGDQGEDEGGPFEAPETVHPGARSGLEGTGGGVETRQGDLRCQEKPGDRLDRETLGPCAFGGRNQIAALPVHLPWLTEINLAEAGIGFGSDDQLVMRAAEQVERSTEFGRLGGPGRDGVIGQQSQALAQHALASGLIDQSAVIFGLACRELTQRKQERRERRDQAEGKGIAKGELLAGHGGCARKRLGCLPVPKDD